MTVNPVLARTQRHLAGFQIVAFWTMTTERRVTPAELVTLGDGVRYVLQDMKATLLSPTANVSLFLPQISVITEEPSIPSADHVIARAMWSEVCVTNAKTVPFICRLIILKAVCSASVWESLNSVPVLPGVEIRYEVVSMGNSSPFPMLPTPGPSLRTSFREPALKWYTDPSPEFPMTSTTGSCLRTSEGTR